MQDIEVIRRARALLYEKGWCQGAQARDKVGLPVDPLAPEAASYCAVGAIIAAMGGEPGRDPQEVVREIRGPVTRLQLALDGGHLSRFNDNADTVDEVLRVFDAALTGGTAV